MIGSPCAYLPRNRYAIMFIYRYPIELFVIGYLRDFTSITRALMDSLAMFPTVFKFYEMRYIRFLSKKVIKKLFFSPNFLEIRLISNWTACRTIKGIIVLVIWNWPHALHSSHFDITRAITPNLYSTRSNHFKNQCEILFILGIMFLHRY